MKAAQSTEVATLTQLLGQWGESSAMHIHDAMISHHRGANAMAHDVATSGVNRNVRQLARDMVKAQRNEIAGLQRIADAR